MVAATLTRSEVKNLVEDVLCNDVDLKVEIDDGEIDRITEKVSERITKAAPAPAPAAMPQEIEIDTAELSASILAEIRKELPNEGKLFDRLLSELKKSVKPVVKRLEIVQPTKPIRKIDGPIHPKFERVLRLAAARKNILLVGPAGCGKTHMGEQLAKALGLRFAHISCTAGMSEGQLLGRLLPVGKSGSFEYVVSEFVRCYEEGGVFLLDEVDSADANTILILNSALANGALAIPNRPEKPFAKRHADFICIAAANTWGNGADRQYVGRNQLDEAFLDRFRIGQIALDYAAEVEAALCPDEALRNRLIGYRVKTQEHRIRRLVSMRFLRDAFDMLQAGDTLADIDEALFSGWSKDERSKVEGK